MGESVGRRPDERPQRGNMTDRSIPSTSSLIIPSPTLQKILDGREYFFHAEQQTGKVENVKYLNILIVRFTDARR